MIGVVVWTNQKVGKAVIWCEDQNDLAYYLGPQLALNMDMIGTEEKADLCIETCVGSDTCAVILREGDLVTFDSFYEGRCRMARNIRLLEEETHSNLADILHDEPGSQECAMSCVPVLKSESSGQNDRSASVMPLLRPTTCSTEKQDRSAEKASKLEDNILHFKEAGGKRQAS